MRKIKRLGGLISAFLLTMYNTCFADVIMPGESPKSHGVQYNPPTNTAPTVIQTPPNFIIPLIIIGILAIVIMVSVIVIICVVMKKKKKKNNK